MKIDTPASRSMIVPALAALVLAAPAAPADHHQHNQGRQNNQAESSQGENNQGEWTSLFNGKNLDGWEKVGGEATYQVENGAIVGTSGKGSNTFLASNKKYDNFELVLEVKLDDNQLNSGVQVRSKVGEHAGHPHLIGPQVEIEAAEPANVQATPAGEAGYIYGEATGRGWLSKDRKPTRAFQNDQWNKYRIRAVGDRIQTWINGRQIADLKDPQSNQSGVIGLQVHQVPADAEWSVRWRNIKIRPISSEQ